MQLLSPENCDVISSAEDKYTIASDMSTSNDTLAVQEDSGEWEVATSRTEEQC
jgi:hypothetical protein